MKAAGLGLVTPDGLALFLKRGPDKVYNGETWCFPGGKLDGAESALEAAIRETREEIGWIAPEGAAPPEEVAVTQYYEAEYTTFRQQVTNQFIPDLGDGEHVGYAWAPLNDPPQPLHPGMVEVLPRMVAAPVIVGDSRAEPEHRLVLEYDGDFDAAALTRTLQILGSWGASRNVEVAGEDSETQRELEKKGYRVKFNWDGDGADKIWSAVIDGVDVLVVKPPAEDVQPVTVTTPNTATPVADPTPRKPKPRVGEDECGLPAMDGWGPFARDADFKEQTMASMDSWGPFAARHENPVMAADRALLEARASMPEALALDEASVRSYDEDGRLHVAESNISKACVNPYLGREIPGWSELGLDPQKIYYLLRDPEELAKAVPTFNNLQVLSKHSPVTASEPSKELVEGSLGSNARWDPPYIKNDLFVWTQEGIDGVDSSSKKELSAAYRYDPDMTPGVFGGQSYDGVMRNIRGNHVALVERGRAGADVVVGDSAEELTRMSKKDVKKEVKEIKPATRGAALLASALAYNALPVMAQDAKPLTSLEVLPLFADLRAGNWKDKREGVVTGLAALLKDRIAMDEGATPDDVALRLIEMIAGSAETDGASAEGSESWDDPVSPDQNKVMEAAAEGHSDLGVPKKDGEGEAPPGEVKKGNDEGGVHAKILEFLTGKLSPEDMEAFQQLMAHEDEAEEAVAGDEKEDEVVGDDPPPFKGKPNPGGSMDENKEKENTAMDNKDMVTKTAMDSAINA